jgi:hypothetical protein
MYGDLQGIAGRSMLEIPALELADGEHDVLGGEGLSEGSIDS